MHAGSGIISKKFWVTVSLTGLVYAAVQLCTGFTSRRNIQDVQAADSAYAGASTCVSCHRAVHDSVAGTAHYLTSRPAADSFIKGSFAQGRNHFSYNQFMEVRLEKKDSGFFQTVYINGEASHSEPMDIVVGSGKKGQTYLYWKEDLLYQLPVSYYVPTASWCNSPGYPPGMPRFNRLIPGRCLECHGSRAEITDAGNNVNYFNRSSVVYGVDCERCHGPAATHVAYHQSHPGEKTGRYILLQREMNRQQKLDLCALCHSGIRTPVKQAFTFIVGKKLEDFSMPKYNTDSAAALDVHGNQYGLLTSSKCFQQSDMTCASCHQVHGREVDRPALFSVRCQSCHGTGTIPSCKVQHPASMVLADNCIDCHMPALPSKAIFLQLEDRAKSTADFVRSHRVAIYPDAARKFLRLYRPKS